MAETKTYLRYVPGTDEFETLEVSDNGTVRGRVKTDTADKMRKAGARLVGDDQWAAVSPPTAAERQRAQVVERSGAGAPGMVYAERDGAPVLMSLPSAERQGLRVISADEARRLGETVEAREDVVTRSGTGAPGMVYVDQGGAPVLMPLESAERQNLRVISADEARTLGSALEEREAMPQQPAASGPGIWGQIAQSVLGATPAPASPRSPEEVARGVIASRPAPVQGNPAQDLVQSTGLGFAPAATPPRGRAFSGFRGDPAVVVRQPDGTSTPGGVNAAPYTASAARGGNAPPVEQPQRALTPEDAAIPTPQAGGTQAASAAVRFTPSAPSAGQKELAAAFAQQREAVAAQAALSEQQAAAEQARLDAEIQATREREAREAERIAAAQAAVTKEQERLTQMVSDLSSPSGQVDPDRWWNSRDTGQKIAAFASAFMTGFAGRPNVIQQMIDRDIAAQQFNLDRADRQRTRAVEGQRGLVALARERFQDELLANTAARAAATEAARKVAERETAGFKGQQAQVRRQELLGALAQAEVEAKQAFQARASQLGLQQADLALRTAQLNAAQQQAQRGAAAEIGGAVPISALTPEQRKRAVTVAPGRAVLALNEDAAKKAQEGWISGQQTLRILDNAINLRREYGPEVLPTEGKQRLRSIGLELIGALNRRNKFGALDKGTQELLEQMAGGDLTSVGQVLPVLEQIRAGTTQDMAEEFQAYTGQPIGGVQSFQTR